MGEMIQFSSSLEKLSTLSTSELCCLFPPTPIPTRQLKVLSDLFLLKSSFMLWPKQVLRSPLVFCTLFRCAHPCSHCIVIFSVVYCSHSITNVQPSHTDSCAHVQLFCVLTRRVFSLLSLVQLLGDVLFRLAAVSRVGWSKLRKWALPGQGGHAAQHVWGHELLPTDISVLCVFLRSLPHLLKWR